MLHTVRTSPLFAAALAAGVLALSPSIGAQVTEDFELLPLDGIDHAEFGRASALADGLAVVGAPGDDDQGPASGSIYIFDAITASPRNKIVPADATAGDRFGFSVAIADGVVMAGAPFDVHAGISSGSAYVFDLATGNQIAKLVPPDGAAGDEFGFAVACEGNVAAVGAKRDDDSGTDSGSLYLFDLTTGSLLHKLLPNDGAPIGNFGESVDIHGGLVAAGAHGTGFLAGAAYIFDVGTGSQLHKLLPDDSHSNMFFGTSLALDDGLIVIGAWADSVFFDHSGSAYVFDTATGDQLHKLVPSDGHDRDHFGYSVSIDDGLVAIGAEQDGDSAFNGGSAYLFEAASGAELSKFLASDGQNFDVLGSSIAIEDGILLVGAPGSDDSGDSSGSAYLFDSAGSVGTSACFGDGTGTVCPCGNSGGPGRGCANSASASGSVLRAYGSASILLDDLVLRARGSTPSAPGVFFQGSEAVAAGLGSVLGDGLLCAGGTIVRLEVAFANREGSAESQTSIASSGSVLPGQVHHYQWWYRDSNGSPCGAGFNLSNSVQIAWVP